MRHVEASIPDDSNILRAAIGFDAVIVNVSDVVADVRRNRHDGIVGLTVGVTVRRVIDSLVKLLDTIVRDHVPRAINLHSVLGKQRLREARQILPGAADPTHQTRGIVAPDKNVVGNVEITRPAPVGEDAAADIFQLGVFESETDGAQDALMAEEEGDVGISDGDPFDVVIVGSSWSNKTAFPPPSKTTSPSPAALITIGFSQCHRREVEGSVEKRRVRPGITSPIFTIGSGVNQNGVAGLYLRLKRVDEVGAFARCCTRPSGC